MTEITSKLSTALADRYQIERHLGEGGMATVYLAEDLKHKRKVAVKVLRPELAAVLGAERFVQEITTTANLQHPHILPLFDSGEADSFLYYVMPFIDGETLRDKLNRETQLGIEEAVAITTAIADALDYAHRQNVIHRDIKPENILLHEGRPMVADFGIALAVSAAAGGRMTETGLSLGTPHYMSPEQATAEKDLTARSDIYSLGSVLYEMLTGEPPHVGGSAQAIIMKIVTDEARSVTELRKSVPSHVAAATAKSLERLAADRFESAKAFADALTNPAFTLPTVQGTSLAAGTATDWKQRFAVPLAALAAVLLFTTVWTLSRPKPPTLVSRYSVRLSDALWSSGFPRVALSPDGNRFLYAGSDASGNRQLFLRHRDQLEAATVPGTTGGGVPFFSPDGSRAAFVTFNPVTLRVMSLGGGPPLTIADSGIRAFGGGWGPDGFLYVTGFAGEGLQRFPASGGDLESVTTVDSARGETDHLFPEPLPNGKGVLFTVRYGPDQSESDIAIVDLSNGRHKVLVRGVYARYAASGHLVYVTADQTLLAAPLDQNALARTGDATALVEGLSMRVNGSVDLTISTGGRLIYATGTGGGEPDRLGWVARDGTIEEVDPGWTANFESVSISPDGTQAAVGINDGTEQQIWIKQLDRGPLSKRTFEGTANTRPTWTPDGRGITFISNRGASPRDVYVKRADGSAMAEVLIDVETDVVEAFWTRDGQWLVYRSAPPTRDIYGLPLGDSVPVPLVTSEFNDRFPAVSPDGRWLAYDSDESGRREVFVRPFPNTGEAMWPVSTNGGRNARWAHSGRELFYINTTNEMEVVEILAGPTFAIGERRVLFPLQGIEALYDVAPDDQRFLMIPPRGQTDLDELIIVENFFEELKAKVGN